MKNIRFVMILLISMNMTAPFSENDDILSLYNLYAEVKQQERFSGERAFIHIQELCKPEYNGRMTGFPGAREAAQWIGEQFKSWGLEAGGDSGSYIQEYPMILTRQAGKAHMQLINGAFGRIKYQEGVDFTVYFNSGSGEYTADVVFVGYGLYEPAMGRDDYADVDVHKKIVLIYRGLPQDGHDWDFANERDYKMRVAADKGAIGLLMLDKGDWPIRGGTIHEAGYNPKLVAVNISKKVALDLFSGTYKNLDNVVRDLGKKPNSFSLGKTVRLQAQVNLIQPAKGENVVGILSGSDDKLRNEFIVIGGHMDHNGRDLYGHLYAGADDDASGTAVVMELAQIFARLKERPKRSLVFAGFGGEEQGLRGSWYFAYHPPVAGAKICAMLNFDMEGTGDGGAGLGGRNYFPQLVQKMIGSLSDAVMKKFQTERGWGMGGSDYSHFLEQGIPAMGFCSTGGHPFYHKFEDDLSTINVSSLQFVGDRAVDVLLTLANWPESLLFENTREGYFFLRHGEQIDFAPGTFSLDQFSDDIDNHVAEMNDRAVRMVVVPLDEKTGANPTDHYARFDNIDEWVKKDDRHLLRFENSSSLDQAASNSKLAIAIGLYGTFPISQQKSQLRNLVKMGLNVMQICDSRDALFENDQVSEDGKEILKICQRGNVLLDCTLQDTNLVARILNSYQGKLIWRIPMMQARFFTDFAKKNFVQDRAILSVVCKPWDDAHILSQLINVLGCELIYVLVEPAEPAVSPLRPTDFVQALYIQRQTEVGTQKAYKEMEKIMGKNIKKILNAGD